MTLDDVRSSKTQESRQNFVLENYKQLVNWNEFDTYCCRRVEKRRHQLIKSVMMQIYWIRQELLKVLKCGS